MYRQTLDLKLRLDLHSVAAVKTTVHESETDDDGVADWRMDRQQCRWTWVRSGPEQEPDLAAYVGTGWPPSQGRRRRHSHGWTRSSVLGGARAHHPAQKTGMV